MKVCDKKYHQCTIISLRLDALASLTLCDAVAVSTSSFWHDPACMHDDTPNLTLKQGVVVICRYSYVLQDPQQIHMDNSVKFDCTKHTEQSTTHPSLCFSASWCDSCTFWSNLQRHTLPNLICSLCNTHHIYPHPNLWFLCAQCCMKHATVFWINIQSFLQAVWLFALLHAHQWVFEPFQFEPQAPEGLP